MSIEKRPVSLRARLGGSRRRLERNLRLSLLRISLDLAILGWYIRDGKTYLNDRYFDQMPALPMQSLRT